MADRTIFDRLHDARAAMSNPPMRGTAQYGNYATLADVLAVVLPALLGQGLSLRQGITSDGCLATEVFDREGNTLTLDMRPIILTDNPQKNGSAETYAKRYALCTVFCLVGMDDDDGAAASAPRQNALQAAKERVWAALRANMDEDQAKDKIAALKAREDFTDTPEFWNRVAHAYEANK